MLQRRRQCELVLLDRPCLLSLAGEVPVRLGELGPVIDPRREEEEEEKSGQAILPPATRASSCLSVLDRTC